jgi:hypothetical protein
MMHRQQQDLIVFTQPEYTGTKKRTLTQIKGAPHFLMGKTPDFLFPLVLRTISQIHYKKRMVH